MPIPFLISSVLLFLYLAKTYFAEAPTENASPAKCLISKLYISQRRPLRMPRLRNSRFRNYIFGGGLYMTLGPKFYISSVFSPRICFCFVKQYCIAGIAAFFEILLLAASKHVLKRSQKSWIFRPRFTFLMNFCPRRATFRPRFTLLMNFCPRRATKLRSL